MPHNPDPTSKDTLLSPSRQEQLDPQRILSLLPIRPYHVVADVGCGPGYFTIPLAKYLFDGRVYAIDVRREMLDALQERLRQVHLSNVEVTLSSGESIPINKESLDGALLAFVLHETGDRETFLRQVLDGLKKGGWTAVLEWYKKEMNEGPPLEARLEEGETRGLAERVGFRFTSYRDLNGKHYMLLLRK